jgi:Trypsin-co-occurring domain 1
MGGAGVAERRLVCAGGAEFYVEVADAGGPATIDDHGGVLSFGGVRATVEGIAAELVQAWEKVEPSEACVEFGLKLTAKSGKLTGLVIEGGGEASLRVTLRWQRPGAADAG